MSTQVAGRTSVNPKPALSRFGRLTILGGVLQFIAGIGVENRSGEFSPPFAVVLFLIGRLCLIAGDELTGDEAAAILSKVTDPKSAMRGSHQAPGAPRAKIWH